MQNYAPIVNEEQLLELALFAQMTQEEPYRVAPAASSLIIISYIIRDMQRNDEEIPEDREEYSRVIAKKMNEMCVSYTCNCLAKNGLIDVAFDDETGEPLYRINDTGRKYLNESFGFGETE